jgi:hypothetical protein
MWVLGKKLERYTFLEFKSRLNFLMGKYVRLMFEVTWYIYFSRYIKKRGPFLRWEDSTNVHLSNII